MPTFNHGYRIELNAKIGCEVLDGKQLPPDGVPRIEYALYYLLCAVGELGKYLGEREAQDGKGTSDNI